MRLRKARVRKYRSIRDTGLFDIEPGKTILVGPNEAGKSALLAALQRINPPGSIRNFDALRDYPRSEFNDLVSGKIRLEETTIAEGHFDLEAADKEAIPAEFRECRYIYGRRVDNSAWHMLDGGPSPKKFGDLRKDLAHLLAHVDSRVPRGLDGLPPATIPSAAFAEATRGWEDSVEIKGERAATLKKGLEKVLLLIEEGNETEEKRYDELMDAVTLEERRLGAVRTLHQRLPVFVRFRDYFKVRPLIHLEHLAQRLETNVLDGDYYDYGNQCLLRLLGFSARELSNLGKADQPKPGDADGWRHYRDQLDRRAYQLNCASVRLSEELRSVWKPDAKRAEAERLRIVADGQYLKVVVEDDLGVEIELDQRSEGFQWLVSFFVVFFAESADKHKNAILLLDEPGLSLHGLKQQEFRSTISRLAESNQLLYTTHSPFLVGPDELDRVRVVEMIDRSVGTKVRTNVTAEDPAALLPLQESLGYDLAQSLFSQQRNLLLESLTDFWYIEAVAQMLRDAGIVDLNPRIELLPTNGAAKVAYFATILHAKKLKVAALLDSDTNGDRATHQDDLVRALGHKAILRSKDARNGVRSPRVEDLLRETLLRVGKNRLGWDITSAAAAQPDLSIVDVFTNEIGNEFSQYRLAKAFLRWTRDHTASDLSEEERGGWKRLIDKINATLK
ncbi:MAG TPA: AAA family ATPase [Chthoniobacterales bacterium]|jgi:predicted ATPase|nr:AAA family ATPase [Chthoniobacterales bacterium]